MFQPVCLWMIVCLFLFVGVGCQPHPSANKEQQDKQAVTQSSHQKNPSQSAIKEQSLVMVEDKEDVVDFEPFHVYTDKASRLNHYIPSGFMPNGKCIKFSDRWEENCFDGNTCIRIDYDTECSEKDQKWSGIYWLNPPNNWGQRKGGFNLNGAKRLSFRARGELGGEYIQEFIVGGITGKYPDSDFAVFGPVILTPEWKEYSIDLTGKDLSYISGGFAWTTSVDGNQGPCIFYLDNIRYH